MKKKKKLLQQFEKISPFNPSSAPRDTSQTDLETLNLNHFDAGPISNGQLDPKYLSPYNIKSLTEFKLFGSMNCPNFYRIAYSGEIDKAEQKNFDKDPWLYTINQYGFRDEWKSKAKRPNIAFYGCSNTFGVGVESSKHWTHLLSKHLNMCKYNFGISGASALRCARTFIATQQVFTMNYAVILFPSLYRIDYCNILSEDERANNIALGLSGDAIACNLLPNFPPGASPSLDKANKSLYGALDDNMFIMSLIYAVSMITESAKVHNVKIVFATWDPETLYTLGKIGAPNLYPNIGLKGIDVARDELHPGPETSKLFAEEVGGWMKQQIEQNKL